MTSTPSSAPTSRDITAFLTEHNLSIELLDKKGSNSGYLALSLGGTVALGEHTYHYHLIPTFASGEEMPGAVLAKRQRWSKLSPAQKLEILQSADVAALRANFPIIVEQSCLELVQGAVADGLKQTDCSDAFLALLSKSHTFFERLTVARDRVRLALDKLRFEQLAEKTKAAINLADYPASFSAAYRMKRKLIAILGEPNSGKTYEAMQELIKAKSGVYLAPLRLLALEIFERLRDEGVKVSMVTGEECRLIDGSTHTASTIEMLDFQTPVDVAVIDEVQVLDDQSRGSAWTAAICGVPAKTVFLIGSLTSKAAIIALAERLNCELEIKTLKRKAPLLIEKKAISDPGQLKKGDAVIAFSRKEVLNWREIISAKGLSVAAVYGNLSPEVRQGQAKLFREGQADVLVGTDALAMGLNMPISRVVFTTHEKFDGVETVEIPDWLAQQIGGRAGRYGMHEKGYVTAFGSDVLERITEMMSATLEPIRERGFWVSPTIEHLKTISLVTESDRLYELLLQFKKNIDVHDSFFLPASLTDQLERANWLDTLSLTLEERFLLSLVPLSLHVGLHSEAYESWSQRWAAGEVVRLKFANIQLTDDSLQLAEDTCKLFSGYIWLSYRRPDVFPDGPAALTWVRTMSEAIDLHFKQSLARRVASVARKKALQQERDDNRKDETDSVPSKPVRIGKDERRSEKNQRLQSLHEANETAHQAEQARLQPPPATARTKARKALLDSL